MKAGKVRNQQIYRANNQVRNKQLGASLSKQLRQKYGRRHIRILDGGIAGWKASGGKTNILAPSKPKAGNFTAKFDSKMMMATMKDVQTARKNTSKYQIWDTRETKECKKRSWENRL